MSENERPVVESQVTFHQLMLPEHANALGKVHGGIIMKLVDESGAICAMRHARRPCVTVAIDSMSFLSAVEVGEVLTLNARVTYVGRTSIEVGVRVEAEDPITGETTHTNSAFVVYVALDENGRPAEVPGLAVDTDEDRRRWKEGKRRQEHRLGMRSARER